jgi:hypothetical protein
VQRALKHWQVVDLQDCPASLKVLLPVRHHGRAALGNLARSTVWKAEHSTAARREGISQRCMTPSIWGDA